MSRPLSLWLYALATAAAEPLAGWLLRARARRGKEDAVRVGERLGHASLPRPPGALVWLHGASVGECLSLLPLAEALRKSRPDAGVLVTSGTVTAAELLAQRLPDGAVHQYAPIDAPRAVARFLAHWRPDLAVFVESEIWPGLLRSAKGAGCKLVLASAKLSDKSQAGWRRFPGAAQALLSDFDLVLAQDIKAAERLRGLGARVSGIADLKFGAAPLPVDAAALARGKVVFGDRAVLVAASTHPGEESLILAAFRKADRLKDAVLVIVPRHPARGREVASLVAAAGFTVARQAASDQLGEAQVVVADTLGDLGLWYRLADLAVVCGSLTPQGMGHNPLEPARLGCPTASGPHVGAWSGIYEAMVLAEGVKLADAPGMAGVFRTAVDEPRIWRGRAAKAREYVMARDEAARDALVQIIDLLP